LKNARIKNVLLVCWPFVASSVMLTVIQPPFNLSFLAWVALAPFIVACSPAAKLKHLMLAAYLVSLFYWLGNLYWIFPITVIGWVAFCLYMALLWPAVAFALHFCRAKKIPLFLAAGVVFVGAERLQGLFLGGFFWRFLAHSQYANITLIQIADIFGAAGLSFLIAMVNGLAAEWVLAVISCHPERSEGSPLSVTIMRFFASLRMTIFLKTAFVGAAVAAAIFYGRWRIEQSDNFIEQGPLVASLQSNVPQSVKRTFEKSDEIFDELMKKSKASAKAGAELIVWPETMVQSTLDPRVLSRLTPSYHCKIVDKTLREHSKKTAYVLVGAYGGTMEMGADLTIHLPERHNSAFLYQPDGTMANEQYNKIHLVPFGEFLPFRKSFPWLYNLLMKFTPYNYDYSLDAGTKYTVFEMTNGQGQDDKVYKFSVMICYEDTIPAIARRFAMDERGQKRLDWLVNISNDGWFVRFKKGKVFPRTELAQHASICVFRAVENRLSVVRSVNTGISCIIDSVGRIKNGFLAGSLPREAMARIGVAGWLVDRVPIDKRTTFFSKYGQWLDFCCAFCLILFIIGASVRLKMKSGK